MVDFLLSKHFVITLYILSIAAASVLFVTGVLLAGRNRRYRVFKALGALMVIRLIIKLIYFYVEFYIASWPLNIAINVAMDSSYVFSMLICIRLISIYVGREKKEGRTLRLIAAFFYVFLWLGIQIYFVDPGSNHYIRFTASWVETVYFLNELFFYLVFLFDVFHLAAMVSRHRGENRGWYMFFTISCAAYLTYVFFWDVSFVVPALEPFRMTKPLDGVLIFSICLFIFYFFSEAGNIKSLFSAAEAPAAIGLDEALDPLPFAQAYSLSAREKEVLSLVTQGKSNSEIAQQLYIADNTVKRHLTSIYKKCKASNRTQLLLDIVEWNKTSRED